MASVINQIKLGSTEYAIAPSAYAECSTGASTQAKVASIVTGGDTSNNAFTLIKGVSIQVNFTNANSAASPTLNVAGTGAKPIHYKGAVVPTTALKANIPYIFVYDGANWDVVGHLTNTESKTTTLSWGTTSTIGTVDGADLKVTMPANPAYVTQTSRATNGAFPVLLRGTSAGNSTVTTTTSFNSGVTVNPSTGKLTAARLESDDDVYAVGDIWSEGNVTAEGHFVEGQTPVYRKYSSLIPEGTAVSSNANLNTTNYLKVGNYYCSADVTAATLTNCPTGGKAFMMQVYSPLATTIDNESTGTWVYRVRKILTYQGYEYQQCVSSGATAGTFTYGAWEAKPAATLSGTTLTLKI